MTIYKLVACSAATVLILGSFACKKNKKVDPGNAKLAIVDCTISGSTTHYHIYYDQNNNVDSITLTSSQSPGYNSVRKFNYSGSSYTITDQNNSISTVFTNTDGMITKLLTIDTISMIYSGNEVIESDYRSSGTLDTAYLSWKNGDMQRVTNSIGINRSFIYDLGKNGQSGDGMRIADFLKYGRSYLNTNHLVTNVTDSSSGFIWNYYYKYDSQGRISQCTLITIESSVPTSDSVVYVYAYY
jgi:hypothetical protein